jgi:YHS domain-containing protein
MVRDRICGMHVPEEQALTLTQGSETLYFCGPDCRDRHLTLSRGGEGRGAS